MKSARYLSYGMLFVFAIWAMGLAACLPPVVAALRKGVLRAVPELVPVAAGGAVALSLVVVVLGNGFSKRALELALGSGVAARGDWSGVATVVGDWQEAPFLATTRELHLMAELGEYDLLISKSRVDEVSPPQEFSVDFRTGRPVIGSAASIAAVLACERDGLLVTSPFWWTPRAPEMQDLFAQAGLETEIRREGAVLALRWRDADQRLADCSGVP